MRDDAMEDGAVVEGLALLLLPAVRVFPALRPGGEAHEVLDRLGCVLGEQLHDDGAHRSLKGRVQVFASLDVCHEGLLGWRAFARLRRKGAACQNHGEACRGEKNGS
jgi:hypothetical protein